MEDLSQEVVRLSKINSAGLINMRINNIWIEVNKAAVSGNYLHWNSQLDRIWCELVGDIKKGKEDKDGKYKESIDIKKFNELDKNVSKELVNFKKQEGFSTLSKEDKEKMSKIYHSLIKKESFLRTLMNTQGKGTAYQEEADWD